MKLDNSRNKVLKTIEDYSEHPQQSMREMQTEKDQIKQLSTEFKRQKQVICFEKTTFMKRYLDEKICKKIGLLLTQKDELMDIERLTDNSNRYFSDFNELKQLSERFPQTEK